MVDMASHALTLKVRREWFGVPPLNLHSWRPVLQLLLLIELCHSIGRLILPDYFTDIRLQKFDL